MHIVGVVICVLAERYPTTPYSDSPKAPYSLVAPQLPCSPWYRYVGLSITLTS